MLPEFFAFYCPTKVVFETGIVSDLKPELDTIGIKKYFVVSDHIINDLGLVQKVADGLAEAGCEMVGKFLDVKQDARLIDVNTCTEAVKASGAEGIISVGGGSVIDTAKAVNIIFSEGGDLVEDYSGGHLLTRPLKPHIVVPTTAGTGSEVTMLAVIYDEENKEKLFFADKFLHPNLAVLDPEMTLSLPPKLTASTGMDALTHSIEAYVGVEASPFSDAFAAGAIELIMKYLVTATENGEDIEARGAMLIASAMAGIAFTHSMVGCIHGMSHVTGALYRVPHGEANAIYLPYGMEYNFEEITEKLARLAAVMGEEVSGLSEEEAAKTTITAVRNLTGKLHDLGALPIKLSEVGVPEDGLKDIADAVPSDGTSFYNPREVDEAELLPYIQRAF